MDDMDNIEEMADYILGDIDAGKRTYRLPCVDCGDLFEARTPNAKYCPACLKKRRAEGGRKGAEKAHGLRAENAEERIPTSPSSTVPRNDAAANALPSGHCEEAAQPPTRQSVSPARQVTREGVLDAAKAVVCGAREQQYGSPEDSFRAIADYWTVYLHQTGNLPEHRELTSEDVAMMMILLKVARQAGRGKLDNWVDIAGYAACGAEISDGRRPE